MNFFKRYNYYFMQQDLLYRKFWLVETIEVIFPEKWIFQKHLILIIFVVFGVSTLIFSFIYSLFQHSFLPNYQPVVVSWSRLAAPPLSSFFKEGSPAGKSLDVNS